MSAAPKSRTGLYVGLGALGAGAYYFYRAGGDPKVAKQEIKHDANKARAKAPGTEAAERAGEKAGLQTNLNIDEAANNPTTKNSDLTSQAQRKLDELSQTGKDQAGKFRDEAGKLRDEAEQQATKLRNEAEEKASEAKGALPVSPSKKRKLHELENVDCAIQGNGAPEKNNQSKQEEEDENNLTLTPSKSLKFSSLSVSSPRRSGHYRAAANKTKPLPRSDSSILPTLRPACVQELVALHSAFLKAVTFHAAHRGVAAPADLREFLPSVERIWKKRKVVVKDLQRILWITGKGGDSASGTGSMFRLANHGLGRVCLERVNGRVERIDHEGELQEQFEGAVDLLWEKAVDAAGGDESRVDFMAMLGLASIDVSLTPFTAFRKGQQRLQDLRGGVMKVKMEGLLAESAADEEGAAKPARVRDATTSRRNGLLDRIKDKELRQAKLPPPPSKDVMLRRAAAGRIEEVAGVLALLRPVGYVGSGPTARTAAQRIPFCLGTIIRNVQDSTRNPISASEVEACLEILSREDVAGHWVSIVVVNQLKSLVLKSCGDVQLKGIAAKVSQLKPGWEESPKLLV
ncbi:hypothetical protein BJX76DRAFT_365671 [Aspergillus varians]